MTNEYKKTLLNYVTGNLQETQPENRETFKEIIEIDRSNWINYIPSDWNNFRVEGYVNPNENTSNLGILYGGYMDISNNSHGFIILTDINMKPIKSIYQYSNGTKLRYIQCMRQDKDGTFYFIDDNYFSYNYENTEFKTSQKRFVIVNNFTIPANREYTLNLRKSYIFSSSDNNFYCREIFKDTNSSNYVFLGKNMEDYINFISIQLKINVGEKNEWNKISLIEREYGGGYVKFDENGNYYSTVLLNQPSSLRKHLIIGTKNYTSNSYTETQSADFHYYITIDTHNFSNQYEFINENEVYFVGNNQIRQIGPESYDKYIGLYKYNLSNNSYQTIFEKKVGSTSDNTILEAIYISQNLGKIYLEYNTNIDTTIQTSDYYIQRLEDDNWDPILLGNYSFLYNQRGIYVGNKFNLIQIIMYPTNLREKNWNFIIIKEIYNPNQYNGKPYVAVGALTPLYSNLYSNGSLIFSRKLFNTQTQSNTTISSVEVPNNYLNDVTIDMCNLISQTNIDTIKQQTNINKNIYETVDINFINTLIIQDRNEINNPITNILGQNRINNSINTLDYDNAKMTKAKINYQNGTTKIIPIQFDNEITETTSTNNEVKITNALQKTVQKFKIYGKSEQGRTPTPDAPVDIKSLPSGNILEIDNVGKNKFNYKNAKALKRNGASHTIIENGIRIIKSDTGTYRYVYFDLGELSNYKGEYVTLSLKYDVTGGGTQRYGLSKMSSDGTKSSIISYATQDSITIQVPEADDTYTNLALLLNVNTNGAEEAGIYVDYTDIQLELGTESTKYEEYRNDVTYVNMGDKKLCSIEDTEDEYEVVSGKGIKKIGEIVLDGSENWIASWNNNGLYRYVYVKNIGCGVTGKQLCTHFKCLSSSEFSSRNTQGIYFENNNYNSIITTIPTLAEFKTWLSENPVTVKYILETPEEFTLQPTNIKLIDGTNNIILNDVLETNLSVKYYTNNNIKQLQLSILVEKLINNIQLISNDEKTIYQTINLESLEINKIYTINQNVEVI